jgi:hypothetical protein
MRAARRQSEGGRVHEPLVEALHQPSQLATDLDAVEAERVGPVVERLSRPLVEDATQRAHGLVGLVVLLELAVELLAHRGAGLATLGLLLRGNRLLVELLEVVTLHQPLP